ncbi:MAG: ABC transporter substrate-binding protein, partial [Chloroflexi bacterium]|nr:ABC transporter substrate-binding protein [Chloroflexota bacterium]
MSTLRRTVAVVTAVAIMAMSGPGTRASDTRMRVPGAPRPFTLRVGLVFPFTGDLSTYGPSLDKSALLAVKVINSALKKDHISWASIRVVGSEDDQTTPAAGVEAAKKLVNINHAQVIIGSMASSVTLAIVESVALPNNVIVITPTSSDPSLTLLKNENHLVWRVYPSDTLQGAALAEAMGRAFGKHATINVGARNDAFGTALAAIFEKNWKAGGGKIGKVVIYNPAETSFDSDAQKLASGNPNGWLIADFPPTFAKMGPALVRAGGWSPAKTYMTEAMDNNDSLNQIGAPATDGLRGTAASAPKGPNAQALETLFKQTYPGV